MMKIKLAVLAATLAAPIAFMLILRKSNRKKEERYKQILQPLIALAFCVLCCLFFSKLNQLVDWLLNLSFMAGIKDWIQGGSGLAYGLRFYSLYLLNLGILIAYLLFKNGYRSVFSLAKKVILFFIRLVTKKSGKEDEKAEQKKNSNWREELPESMDSLPWYSKLYWSVVNVFYDIDGHTGTVRPAWLCVGKVFLYAVRILGIVYLTLILFAQLPLLAGFGWYPTELIMRWIDSSYLWPAISIVLVTEAAYFLNGCEETYLAPEEKEILSTPEPQKQVDYSGLVSLYQDRFPERYVDSLKTPGSQEDEKPLETENELTKSIHDRLKDRETRTGKPVNKTVLNCISNLAGRQNALVDAILSADFGECLLLYLNVLMARGENVLVLCRDEDTCQQTANYLNSVLEKINLLAQIWMVRSLKEAYQQEDCDILVVTPQSIMDPMLHSAKEQFFRHLSTVLLIDTARLMACFSGLLSIMSDQLTLTTDHDLQYIAVCNGIPSELCAALQQVLSPEKEFYPFSCVTNNGSTRIMLWNYEPERAETITPAQANLFNVSASHAYMGVGIPLACLAAKQDVMEISMMGDHIPAQSLLSALKTNMPYIRPFFENDQAADHFVSSLNFNSISTDDPFLVVQDDSYNLPMTMRSYSRYIGGSAMVHIISKPYMLRDYFADHAADFLLHRDKLEMLSPALRDSSKSVVCKLLSEASSKQGLMEDQLISRLQRILEKKLSLTDALKACYTIATSGETTDAVETYFYVTAHNAFDPKSNKFVPQRKVYLKEKQLLSRLVGDVRPAQVELNSKIINLDIDRDHIFRYYLPDQIIVVNDRMYYIDEIDREEGRLFAGRQIESLEVPVDYTQHRTYTLETGSMRTERKTAQEMGLGEADERRASQYEVELLRDVTVGVETLGYLAPHPSYPVLDLTGKTQYRALDGRARDAARRILQKGSVLAVRFRGVDSDQADKAAITLAVLFSELMKTLFPYNWPCVAVCPVLHQDAPQEGDGVPFENLAMAYPQVTCPEGWDRAADTAEILIIEDSAKDLGVLETLFRNRQHPLSTVFSLLRDYLEWQRTFEEKEDKNIRSDYLAFGAEELPAYFNLSYVEDMLRQLTVTHTSVEEDPFLKSNCCYFCHANLQVTDYVTLRDENGKKDRKVCTACAKRLLNKQEDLLPLFEQAKEYLASTYQITIPHIRHVKFASAAAMCKIINKNKKKNRVVGLAQSLTKTLLVEIDTPKEQTLRTLVHEITHFWQFENLRWDSSEPMEGHSSYMEVQYMHDLGYADLEKESINSLSTRDDEYGRGYRKLVQELDAREDKNPFHYMLEKYPKK